MSKNILLISYNYHPEPTGIGKYNGEMVHWLAKRGYNCTVITTYPYYPYWKVQEPYSKNRLWFKKENVTFTSGGVITIYRCPIYVPKEPSGLKRIILDFSFLVTASIKLFSLLPARKFDYTITVVPSFMLGVLGIFYKNARKTKLIYHIQDLQIEAAKELQLIKSEKVINTLFRIEKYIYNRCDLITSVGEGMIRKIEKKTTKKVYPFLNASDLSQYYPLENRSSLKSIFGFAPSDFILLYSGAIGEKQGLEALLYAAKEFSSDRNVKFLICGSGPYKRKLEALAEELGAENVIFFPLQPHEVFNEFLNMADVHLVIQKANAGDLVMPSKLATILAVGGLAVVTANEDSSLYALVQEHKMGILVEADNQKALNGTLKSTITGDYQNIRKKARFYAENYLSLDKIMGSFEELMIQGS